MTEQDRLVKGRQRVEAQGLVAQVRHAAHAGGLVKDADKKWVAVGAKVMVALEDQHPVSAVAVEWAVADAKCNQKRKKTARAAGGKCQVEIEQVWWGWGR